MPKRRPLESLYTVDSNGCWNWNGPLGKDGYALGTLSAGSRSRQCIAHRLFYERARGPIPLGLVLDHLCRNRCCVNPAHLEAVTQKENKRRSSRLSMEDAQAIRDRAALGESQAAIALFFHVHPGHVSRIVSGKRWSL